MYKGNESGKKEEPIYDHADFMSLLITLFLGLSAGQ